MSQAVQAALQTKAKVLKLTGAEATQALSSTNALDKDIFEKCALKTLQISCPKVEHLSFPAAWPSLAQLEELDLSRCSLSLCPSALTSCPSLRSLVLSDNKLTNLLENMGQLSSLQNLSVEGNQLTSLPASLASCSKLVILQCSRNSFEDLPPVLSSLSALREVFFAYNQLSEIETKVCTKLNTLSVLDCSHNQLTFLPAEMAEGKFKTLKLAGNPFEDKQLRKLADGDGAAKQILTKARGGKSKRAAKDETRAEEDAAKKESEAKKEVEEEKLSLSRLSEFVNLLPVSTTMAVQGDESVAQLRPYAVCVVVKSIRLPPPVFKFCLDLQNKLHKEVGGGRASAAIGVHDLSKLTGPFTYSALDTSAVRFQPLRQANELSAAEIITGFLFDPLYASFAQMLCESDKKTPSPKVALIRDSKGQVLSLPPLINSAPTAISESTTDLFVEVTSASGLAACKQLTGLFLGRLAAHLQSANVVKTMIVEPIPVHTPAPPAAAGAGAGKKKGGKHKPTSGPTKTVTTIFPASVEDFDCIQEAADE